MFLRVLIHVNDRITSIFSFKTHLSDCKHLKFLRMGVTRNLIGDIYQYE